MTLNIKFVYNIIMDYKYFENKVIFLAEKSNLYYFTKLKNNDAYIIFIGNEKFYFTDERYFEDANTNLIDYKICNIKELENFIQKNNITILGIEDSLPQYLYQKLINAGINKTFSVTDHINQIRSVKSFEEIELIKKAQEITDKTFNHILNTIKEGITETELACILESSLYANGADELAFSSIVAFAENTSKPHAIRTNKKLTNNSLITLDFGAKYRGYCSDMTRTIAFGNILDEQKKIYNHVLTAQNLALDIVHSKMTGKECDTISRKYFEEHKLNKYFIHSLGHGVGLDIHEHPRLSQSSNTVLTENMVVTIEPGLYFEKKFGIRIEDLIIFDKTSIINLTKSPKNIIIL